MIFFELGPVGRDKMQFKDISYLQLRQPASLAKQNHLDDFVREHYRENFCKIILFLH